MPSAEVLAHPAEEAGELLGVVIADVANRGPLSVTMCPGKTAARIRDSDHVAALVVGRGRAGEPFTC